METIKCVLVGDSGVGKTSLLTTYTNKTFPKESVPALVERLSQTDTQSTDLKIDKKNIQLTLWDTVGREEYDRLRPLSYPQTDVFVICFSLDSKKSLENVCEKWLPELRHFCSSAAIILVGTKLDLRRNISANDEHVSYVDGSKTATNIGASKYLECSALNGNSLSDVFDEAIRSVISKRHRRRCRCCRPSKLTLCLLACVYCCTCACCSRCRVDK